MTNTAIYNKKTEVVEITLMGDFGENWFMGDITKDSIYSLLSDNSTSDVILNLSSLGGNVDTALAIYDMISSHKGNTTVKLFGRNASSSTFVAMAFDNVLMTESGLFLIHNVWGGINGNAKELRQMADDFDAHDNSIISIYNKKTGINKNKIANLMDEAKWFSAKEALELGFIDKVFLPTKTENKALNFNSNPINNKFLPTLNIMEDEKKGLVIENETSFFDKLANKFKPEIKDISEETKTVYQNQISDLKAENDNLKTNIQDFATKETEIENSVISLKAENEVLKLKNSELQKLAEKEVATPAETKNNEDKLESGKLSEKEEGLIKDFASFKI